MNETILENAIPADVTPGLADRRGSRGLTGVERQQAGEKQINKERKKDNE